MNATSEHIMNLQSKVKSLSKQVADFRTGKKYADLRKTFETELKSKEYENKRLKKGIEESRLRNMTTNRNWMEVFADVEKENKAKLSKKDKGIEYWKSRALRAESQYAEARIRNTELRGKLYEVETELEDEKGKNQKLRAQLSRDHENSSIPSSQDSSHKKISSNRETSGKKPGGQPGHKGHGRKKHKPTHRIHIPAPEKYLNDPDYELTGEMHIRQITGLQLIYVTNEYSTPEFRNKKTGKIVFADFPKGVVNEVNYDGSIKAVAFLLNNHYNVSIDKVREFLSELTNGEINISKGMISGLSKEFSSKTEQDQKKIFSELLLAPVMNIDFTGAIVNGKGAHVAVCANPDMAMFFAREKKGHEGIKGTPAENFQGISVHDHDLTFYSYANAHQECLAHILRYLKDSIQNEPELNWNKLMWALIREMIHSRNRKKDDDSWSEKVNAFEDRYIQILETAKEEYEYEPPSKYFKEGYNLSKRLHEYKDSHLLFLYDDRVPSDNNLAERLLRSFKRKQRQVMAFRSFESLGYLCNTLSVITMLRIQNQNLFSNVTSIFNR